MLSVIVWQWYKDVDKDDHGDHDDDDDDETMYWFKDSRSATLRELPSHLVMMVVRIVMLAMGITLMMLLAMVMLTMGMMMMVILWW